MAETDHVLVVDDDPDLCELLSRYLTQNGYRVTTARSSEPVHEHIATGGVDLIILDIMLPGDDGLTVTRNLRAQSDIPIIMLTARGDETDRIVGLEMGADDYLTKPFNPRELLARIKTVLRRTRASAAAPAPRGNRLRFSGWTLDLASRELMSPHAVQVSLTSGEFNLLSAFAEHPQRVLSRDQLIDLTRDSDANPYDRSIDVQVGRLRKRIEADPKKPRLIKTVRGGGYMFATPVERQ